MKRTIIVLCLVLVLLCCGCEYLDIPGDNSAPDAYIDAVAPGHAIPGETVTFTGHGTDTDGMVVAWRWRSDIDGDLSTLAEFETSSLSQGEHDIYFKVQDNNGAWSSEVHASILVGDGGSTAGLPVISAFSASPTTVAPGEPAMLTWDVSSADAVSIDNGVGNVATSGNTAVSPDATTTYILTAHNEKGAITASTTVTVASSVPPGYPIVNSFIATPNVVGPGEATTLSWNVTGATGVTITPDVGQVATTGTSVIFPDNTTSYTLTATNEVGIFTMTISVVVSGSISDTTPPSIPILLSPMDGDVIPQPSAAWTFDWEDSTDAESGIESYQIYVIHLGAANPVIDQTVSSSQFSTTLGGAVTAGYLADWTWKVRAQNGEGLWSDWSGANTYSVEPDLTTVTLGPVASQSGSITRNSTTDALVRAGDNATNKPIRGFYSFDIFALAGKEVADAYISFSADTVLDDPWQDLEGLAVAQVHFTGPLQVSYYTLPSASITGSFLTTPPAVVDVTSQVASSLENADSRFQVMLRFKEETDADNSGDYITFNNATLHITYIE